MSSKTFKCVEHEEEVLEVYPFIGDEAGRKFSLLMPHVSSNAGITFDSTTAPALALAILEAAGESPLGEARWVNDAKYALGEIAIFRSNKEADAKEQAKLEAEALELFNAWREANDMDYVSDFELLRRAGLDGMWLTVANAARELAGK